MSKTIGWFIQSAIRGRCRRVDVQRGSIRRRPVRFMDVAGHTHCRPPHLNGLQQQQQQTTKKKHILFSYVSAAASQGQKGQTSKQWKPPIRHQPFRLIMGDYGVTRSSRLFTQTRTGPKTTHRSLCTWLSRASRGPCLEPKRDTKHTSMPNVTSKCSFACQPIKQAIAEALEPAPRRQLGP